MHPGPTEPSSGNDRSRCDLGVFAEVGVAQLALQDLA